jgi:hypothetical protein
MNASIEVVIVRSGNEMLARRRVFLHHATIRMNGEIRRMAADEAIWAN